MVMKLVHAIAMNYPYEFDCAAWIKGFSLQGVRDHLRAHAERELAHHKQWFAGLSPEEQAARRMWIPRDRIDLDSLQPTFQDVVGPYEIAIIEQLRIELSLDPRDSAAVPTDVFIWALGEPDQRYVTKVGGLPYRPEDQPWPVIAEDNHSNPRWRKAAGRPMTFLAQICFSGSRDLFPDLPGDVLLIFVEDCQFSRPEAVHLEWQPLGLSSLVEADDLPSPTWRFVTAFGHRHRTVDFAPCERDERSLGSAASHVQILGSTKIGGRPHNVQSGIEREQTAATGGQCLAQLSSLITSDRHAYPWLNHADPWRDPTLDERCLNIVDDGKLYFVLQPDNQVTWNFGCY